MEKFKFLRLYSTYIRILQQNKYIKDIKFNTNFNDSYFYSIDFIFEPFEKDKYAKCLLVLTNLSCND